MEEASAGNPGIPPSSLMAFLRARPAVAGVVLADHDGHFSTPYYHSRFDNASSVDEESIAAAAATTARALHALASGAGAPALQVRGPRAAPPRPGACCRAPGRRALRAPARARSRPGAVQVDAAAVRSTVGMLAQCLLRGEPGLACPLARALTALPAEPATPAYVGILRPVAGDEAEPDARAVAGVARFVWNFLALRTAAGPARLASGVRPALCAPDEGAFVQAALSGCDAPGMAGIRMPRLCQLHPGCTLIQQGSARRRRRRRGRRLRRRGPALRGGRGVRGAPRGPQRRCGARALRARDGALRRLALQPPDLQGAQLPHGQRSRRCPGCPRPYVSARHADLRRCRAGLQLGRVGPLGGDRGGGRVGAGSRVAAGPHVDREQLAGRGAGLHTVPGARRRCAHCLPSAPACSQCGQAGERVRRC
jgi:hypothetical protein